MMRSCDRLTRWTLCAVLFISMIIATTRASFFAERREQKRREREAKLAQRRTGENFVPKLPQTKEAKEWRKNRIEESLAKLDAYIKTAKQEKHPTSRNESAALDMLAPSEMHGHLSEDSETSFLEVGSRTKFAGAVVGGLANALFSRTTMCVMCSYILEMADRQVKASPRWANGGGGFFPGQVDFSPGENQGFFRTYPGGYLEMEESSAPIGSGKPIPPRMRRDAPSVAPAAVPMRMQSTEVLTSQSTEKAPPAIDTSPSPTTNYARAQNMYGMGSDNGMNQRGLEGKKMRVGRFTPRDFDRVDAQSEKSMEYQQMFKDLMDALDEICFKDLPTAYSQYCNLPYMNGEALVEFYLHDYEDWEICTKIFTCISGFYDGL
eukprot:g1658.t1